MKKLLLLVAAFLGISAGAAQATCTGPAVMHDFPGTAFNMGLFQAGDGNCASYSDITTWGGVNLTTNSSSTYGTAPTGTVPGVNAFVTNFPATQPVSVASLPLPSGAATAANQSTEITSLGTIATNSALPLPAQSNHTTNIGVADIGQSTQGTTNGVTNGANNTNTVAASATNFVLSATQGGGTGATGDYLSHCVLQPGTTSPGAVTILDNATTIFSFAGGASSVSNLLPMPIPFGAVSKSGGWKVTTGTNVTLFCVGKFS